MYDNFAPVYDRLMTDADYKSRFEYVLSLFSEHDKKPGLMLDLCCGTGSFSNLFAKKGVSVIGVDISEDMLSLAKEKSLREGNEVMYLCQDAAELDLYGTVDGAICLMDSLNHMTDYDKFCKAIAKVSLFLEKDRLFVFDLNTVYKAEKILGDNTFVSDDNGVYLIWQNEYDPKKLTNTMFLDFFVKDSDGRYSRSSEKIVERAYTTEETENALKNAGFKIEAVYADMKKTPPTDDSQRVFYVTRKL